MRILAIESSAKAASVALCEDGKLTAQYFQNCGLTHSRTLMPMAEALLKNCDLTSADIDLFAAAAGPGSFTGIRIGVSAAKGLAWGAGKPCCGVSTLEAMAWQVLCAKDSVVCCVMDARRNEVYNALFRTDGQRPERICGDRAISLEKLAEEYTGETPWLFVGDGAELCRDYFDKKGLRGALAPGHLIMQSAWGVARAAETKEPVTPELLKPVYLRLSQAEREKLEKEGRSNG